MNNFSYLFLIMTNSAKKHAKMAQNGQKCLKMTIIGQYSTLFDFKKGIHFTCETNRLT